MVAKESMALYSDTESDQRRCFKVASSKSLHYTDLRFMVVVIARVIFYEVFLLSELYHLRRMTMVCLIISR